MELALISTAYGAVYGTWLRYFRPELPAFRMLVGCAASVAAFWLAVQLKAAPEDVPEEGTGAGPEDFLPMLVEQFAFGTGMSLLAHALVTYALLAPRTPFLVAGGSLLSALALAVFRGVRAGGSAVEPGKLLLIGFDNLCRSLLPSLRVPVAGFCGPCHVAPPDGVPWLGDLGDFGAIVREVRPTDILISVPGWENRLAAGELLRLRQEGTRVTEVSALYERLYARICCERLQPVDLVLSAALRGDSRTMAIQAVYNNLIGLALLVALAPLLFLITLGITITAGWGASIESVECAGFQYIPFRLQRFRTTGPDGNTSAFGRLLTQLRLVNLPQLINVVRGDMALVGPRPIRSEFAELLSAEIPFYAHRFSVKPGLTGWAQVHLSPEEGRDTRREIEYDLYYIKAGSLWLDMEILFDVLSGGLAMRRRGPREAERRVEGEA